MTAQLSSGARVDVLRVMRVAADTCEAIAVRPGTAADLREARDDVAELVWAAARANVALRNYRLTGKPDYEALTEASDALEAAMPPFLLARMEPQS